MAEFREILPGSYPSPEGHFQGFHHYKMPFLDPFFGPIFASPDGSGPDLAKMGAPRRCHTQFPVEVLSGPRQGPFLDEISVNSGNPSVLGVPGRPHWLRRAKFPGSAPGQ